MHVWIEVEGRTLFGAIETIRYCSDQRPEGMSKLDFINTISEYPIVEIISSKSLM